METRMVLVASMLTSVFLLTNIYQPTGMMAYYVPSALWLCLALTSLWAIGFRDLRSLYKRQVALIALAVAVAQLFIIYDVGLFVGFGYSTLSFTPFGILINIFYVSSKLLGVELSRSYFMNTFGRKKPILTLAIVSFAFANIYAPIYRAFEVFDVNQPLPILDFLGTKFLPSMSTSLLTSYLSLLGGAVASIAYRAPLLAAEWFIPIYPNLNWGYQVLLGTLLPMLGFVYVSQGLSLRDLRRVGVRVTAKAPGRTRRQERNEHRSILIWGAILACSILMVWFASGLFNIYPTVPVSQSMSPSIEVGDVAILEKVAPEELRVGDVIQFWNGEQMMIHRIYGILGTDSLTFITKGDANNAPDINPVYPSQIRGRVLFTIPMIGWASIYIKETFTWLWNVLLMDSVTTYAVLTTLTLSAFAYVMYRAGQTRRWFVR